MKFYGIEVDGKLEIKEVAVLPTFTSEYQSCIFYNTTNGLIYFGSTSGWAQLGNMFQIDSTQIVSGKVSIARLPDELVKPMSITNTSTNMVVAPSDPLEPSSHTHEITSIDASKIVSGKVSIARLPDELVKPMSITNTSTNMVVAPSDPLEPSSHTHEITSIDASKITGTLDINLGTIKLSNLTDGYIPVHYSDDVGLVDSIITANENNVFITTITDWCGLGFNNESGPVFAIVNNDTSGVQLIMNSYKSGTLSRTLLLDSELGSIHTLGPIGIGTGSPGSKLSVSGGLSVGNAYSSITAPTNGAIFEGSVGIGTPAPSYVKLNVDGHFIHTHHYAEKTYVGGNWYRFLTYDAANQGQEAKIVLRAINGANSVEIKLSKHTYGNSSLGVIAEVRRLGSFAYTHNITKIRLCDDGLNSATHLEVQFGADNTDYLVLGVNGYFSNGLTVVEMTDGVVGLGITKELFISDGVFSTNNQTVLGISGLHNDFLYLKGTGNLGIGTDSPTTLLDINSDAFRLYNSKTLTSLNDTGNQGTFCWDSNYLNICTSTNNWKRISLNGGLILTQWTIIDSITLNNIHCNGCFILSNNGATNEVIIQLPTGFNGAKVTGIVASDQYLTFKAASTDPIRYVSFLSINGGSIRSSSIGSMIELIWCETGWVASVVGNDWQLETS